MKIGVQIPRFLPEAAELAGWLKEIGQAADENGYHSVWVMDHFFQLGGWLGPAEDQMMEGYTTLSYLAGVTERVMLGTMVTGVIYRYPAALIKTVTTLDVLSGGRAYFGIGAGWYEHESVSLGLPFPSMKERFERLEDILRLAHHMWRGDTSPFKGSHVDAKYPYSNPQPIRKPHPPILVGGSGEKKTLRFVAQYADACNIFAHDFDVARHKLDVLKRHCEDVGRDYAEIEKTALFTLDFNEGQMSNADAIAQIKQLGEIGFGTVICNIKSPHDGEEIARIGREIIAEV